MLAAPPEDAQRMPPSAGKPQCGPSPVVEIEALHFKRGQESVFDAISLSVTAGEFLAVIGPNGGGKTTLLQLILGILQPTGGSLRVFGSPPEKARGQIGYVPQYATLRPGFPASVLDMVLMGSAGPSWRGGTWKTDKKTRQKALEYLDTLGLDDCARRPLSALSGGQRQRALVARALMSRPDTDDRHSEGKESSPFLLLLDEPTASIDPQGTFCFYEFLGKLRDSITVIVVSHDLFMTSPFFSGIVAVNKGLVRLECGELTPENLTDLFGRHLHECPVADVQHAGKALHSSGCTHPACAEQALPGTKAALSAASLFSNTFKRDL